MNLILIFIAALIGGLLPIFWKNNTNFFKMALPFSGAFLLSISFTHLIPDTIEEIGHSAGLYILLGFILQLILQQLSHGIEHGHGIEHTHHHPFSYSIFIGLGLHAIIEGMPLAFNFRDADMSTSLTLGIIVHKLPEAFAFSVFVAHTSFSKIKQFLLIIIFALFTPMAAWIFNYLGNSYHFVASVLPHLVSVAIGSFILIATTIFFESESHKHHLSRKKTMAIVFGFAVALSLELLIPHV